MLIETAPPSWPELLHTQVCMRMTNVARRAYLVVVLPASRSFTGGLASAFYC